jgi:hypothetical protein
MFHSVSRVASTIEVSSEKKSIFRSKALRSYSDREQQPTSSTLVTPRSLYLLWALLVLVVFFGVTTWLTEIPVYTRAVAVATNADASPNETTASTIIVIFVPADQLNKLRVGQNVVFKLNAAPHNFIAEIFAVESEVLSPEDAQKRFGPGIQFSNIVEPKAVALARLVSSPSSASLLDYGSSIDAWIQTDSKSVLSLFSLRARALQPADELEATRPPACSGLVRASHARKGEFFERFPYVAAERFAPGETPSNKEQKTERRRDVVGVNLEGELSALGEIPSNKQSKNKGGSVYV